MRIRVEDGKKIMFQGIVDDVVKTLLELDIKQCVVEYLDEKRR